LIALLLCASDGLNGQSTSWRVMVAKKTSNSRAAII